MGKHVASPTCPYCGTPRPSLMAVKRHIDHRPTCSAERLKEQNQLALSSSRLARHRPRVRNAQSTGRHGETNVAAPSPRRNPSITIEEVDDEDMAGRVNLKGDSPRRRPNALLEPTEDEDALEAPAFPPEPPLRRNPSVTIEEVEDEDMPRVPQWGPHPFAKPTHTSLFPEYHPDPTAGAALRFHEVDREPPPKYTSVLADPDVFREAYWLDRLIIPRGDEAEYFTLPRNRDWHWKNIKEFEQEINRLPRGPSWFRETIIVKGDQGDEILDLWKRDIMEMIRHLLGERRFIPHTRFAPERHYDSATRDNRIYGEMWSGVWWWRMQNILGRYATVVPIILSTDKTKLTVFSGNQKAWPVYLTIGNISKDIRRCPSERAMLLVGYLPVSNLSNISDKDERSEMSWQLFHTCMESILEPLKTLSRTGIDVLCADGGVRRVFPILAAYIADFPEQATIACVRESCCPICWIPKKKRGDMSLRYPLRDRCRTLDALDDHWNGYSRTIKKLGIRPTRPFWADLPHVDISTCLAPDLLHQLDKGVFGDHLIKWTTTLLGSNEMDRRTKGMPRFQKLRHFAKGISVIGQWTGKESKALGHTLMTIVAGHENSRFVKAVSSIIDFMSRAHKHEVSESDLAAMRRDIFDFNRAKSVFVDSTKGGLLDHENRFHKICKTHMITHYPYHIRQLGSPEGFSTEMTERLHIDYVKIPWSTTNHNNATQQMIAYLENREAWAFLRAYMHEERLVLDPRFKGDVVDDDVDGEDGPEDVVEGSDGGEEEAWQPTPSIMIAKRPSQGLNVKGAYLINQHQATDLVPATIDYLRSVTPGRSHFPISHNTVFQVWRRCKLRHRRLPFEPALDPQTDQVRAFTTSADEEGRVIRFGHFDVVLFSPGRDNIDEIGLHRFEAGRVRAIFSLPRHNQWLSSEKLAYIERFRPFPAQPSASTLLYTTEHASQAGRRSAIVVPLSQLRLTCHLAPRFRSLDPDLPVSSSTDLLSVQRKFYLNKYASRWLFSVFDYWEKLRRRWNECVIVLLIGAYASSWFLRLSDMTTPANPKPISSIPTSPFCPFSIDPVSIRSCSSHGFLASCIALPLPNSVAGSRESNTPSPFGPFYCIPATMSPLAAGSKVVLAGLAPPATTVSEVAVAAPSFSSSPSAAETSSLVHRRNRGPYARSMFERSTRSPRFEAGLKIMGGADPFESDVEGVSRSQVHARDTDPGLFDTRRQRTVESEQRRRNDLRGGFARLKDALPNSREKCSKMVLLDRGYTATAYIGHLEARLQRGQDTLGVHEIHHYRA